MTNLARFIAPGIVLLGLAGTALTTDQVEKQPSTASREFEVQGFHVRLDLSRQVIAIDVPEDRGYAVDRSAREEVPVSPTLATNGAFVSASLLAQKAKQFDDGLYAAVEEAAQNGAGPFTGKATTLSRLARALASGSGDRLGNADLVLLAACKLGDMPLDVPTAIESSLRSAVIEFLADERRSKPIGFYTWSGKLSAIFRQDRMLQTELKGAAGIAALARAIHADKSARATYEGYLTLVSRLTNPLSGADLRGPLHTVDSGGSEFPSKGLSFFPASRSHETDLVKKLYMNQPIPEGFNLVEEMVKRIRSNEIDLAPTASSGWYDYQTWSLETLIAPDRAAEAARLKLEESYRKQLAELFKGVLALTRETHIKQLEIPTPGARGGPEHSVVKISIRPELSAEPLATFYARRAASYRFVRSVIESTFGADAIRSLHRLTAAGPVKADLAAELDGMEAIFAGAAAAVSRELGLPRIVTAAPQAAPGGSSDTDRRAFHTWARALNTDPDLGPDARMMVPVFFDRGRGKTKVWVFLGWSQRPVSFWFATPPVVEVTRNGQAAKSSEFETEFGATSVSLAYPVTAELYVDKILDRDEFRRHCDRFKTRSAILKNLR
jgi:hypothetical protein